MKKRILALSLLVVAILTFALTGCSSQHKIELYVNGTLYKEYRCDTNGRVELSSPTALGYNFVGWVDQKGNVITSETAITYDVVANAKYKDLVSGKETLSPNTLTESEVVKGYDVLLDIGKVNKVYLTLEGAYIEAEGYCGYHIEDDPKMIMGIGVTKDGKITSVTTIKKVEQTAAYAADVNSEYLDKTYPGEKIDEKMEVAPVSGATLTSNAVLYAVQAASYYAINQLGFGK